MNTQNSSQIVQVARNNKSNTWATPEFAAKVWQADKFDIIEIKARINKISGKIEFTSATEPDTSDYTREIAYANGQGYSYRRAAQITRKHQLYAALGLTI